MSKKKDKALEQAGQARMFDDSGQSILPDPEPPKIGQPVVDETPFLGNRIKRRLKPQYWSLNRIKQYETQPVRAVLQEYVTKGSRKTYLDTAKTGIGTQAHSAIEYGLKHVISEREKYSGISIPHGTKTDILKKAADFAKTKLFIDGAPELTGYVSEVIEIFGMQHLSSFDHQMLLEKQLETTLVTYGTSVGGRMDLITFNPSTDTIMIPDYKTGLEGMGGEGKLAEHTAGKVYALAVRDNLHLFPGATEKTKIQIAYVVAPKPVDHNALRRESSVSDPFVMDFGDEGQKTFKNVQIIKFEPTSDDLDRWRVELGSTIRTVNTTLTEHIEPALRSPIKGAMERKISDMIKSGLCSAKGYYACQGCSVRYICPMSRIFHDKLVYDKASGETVAEKERNRAEFRKKRKKRTVIDLLREEKAREFGEGTGEMKRIIDDLSSGKLDPNIRLDAGEKEDYLRLFEEEFESEIARYGRADISSRMSRGKRNELLPYSIFSREFQPNWLPNSLKTSLKALSEEHIDMLTGMHGTAASKLIGSNLLRDLGKDQVLQNALMDITTKGMKETLGDQGLRITPENVNTPVMQTYIRRAYSRHSDKTLEKLTSTMKGYINTRFSDGMLQYDPDYVLDKYVSSEDRKKLNSVALQKLVSGEVKRDIRSLKSPSDWVEELRKGLSTSSVLERAGFMGKRKIPVGTAMATYMVSYVAATLNSRKRNEDNLKKAKELAAQEFDVVHNQHQSAYSMVMRLLGSDFGSKTRKGFRVSDMLSRWVTRGETLLHDLKDTISTGIAENFLERKPGYDPGPINLKAARVMEQMKGWGISAAPLMIGAAAATAAVVFLGGFFTEGSKDEEIKEKRYKAALKKARLARQERTRIVEKESDTRQQVMRHTPFAFSVLPKVLQMASWLTTRSAFEAAELIGARSTRTYSAMLSRGEFSFLAGEISRSGRLARLASEGAVTPNGGRETIRRAVGRMQGDLAGKNMKIEEIRRMSRIRLSGTRALSSTESAIEYGAVERSVRRRLDESVLEVSVGKNRAKPIEIMKPRTVPTRSIGFTRVDSQRVPIPGRPRITNVVGNADMNSKTATRASSMMAATPVHLNDSISIVPETVKAAPLSGMRITSGSVLHERELSIANLALGESVGYGRTSVPLVPVVSVPTSLPFVDPRQFMDNPRLMNGRGMKAIPNYSPHAKLPRELVG